jgi:hypothetical protein
VSKLSTLLSSTDGHLAGTAAVSRIASIGATNGPIVGESKVALPTLGRVACECINSSLDFGCPIPIPHPGKSIGKYLKSYPIWE